MQDGIKDIAILALLVCVVLSTLMYTCTKACGCIIKCRNRERGSNVRFGYGKYVPYGGSSSDGSPYSDGTESGPPTPPAPDIV